MVEGLVSTVIPVRNRPDLLEEAVRSVLAQDHRPIEVLISDDGSTDETSTVAERLRDDHPEVVRVLRNDTRGPGPAREAGRRQARGEFVQYLDSDDRLLPGKFTVQVRALRERPECGVAYGVTRLIDRDGEVLREPFKWTGRRIEKLFPGLLVDRWWCTHTPLYRRSVTDRVGPWTDLRYSQDWEYDARVGALDVELAWCDVPVSEHRMHVGARQTGHGRWLEPMERVRFFRSLLDCAWTAGVEPGGREARHFSRWVFRHARECGRLGAEEAARRCHGMAIEAAGDEVRWDLRLYGALAALLGWSRMGRAALSLPGRSGPGPESLAQSWMDR